MSHLVKCYVCQARLRDSSFAATDTSDAILRCRSATFSAYELRTVELFTCSRVHLLAISHKHAIQL
jgi:hypothetical protein